MLHTQYCTERKGQLTAGLGSWSCAGSSGRCCTDAGPEWRAAPSMDNTMLQGKGRRAQRNQDRRQTDKGTFISQNQPPVALTFVVKLRSGEKKRERRTFSNGQRKNQPTKATGCFGTSCLQALYGQDRHFLWLPVLAGDDDVGADLPGPLCSAATRHFIHVVLG